MGNRVRRAFLLAAALSTGCGGRGLPLAFDCTPGESQLCEVDGAVGSQMCEGDGRWAACERGSTGAGGKSTSGSGGTGGTSTSSASGGAAGSSMTSQGGLSAGGGGGSLGQSACELLPDDCQPGPEFHHVLTDLAVTPSGDF